MITPIRFQKLHSSNLERVAYNELSETMIIKFNGRSGDTAYCYAGVPLEVYHGLIQSSSPGKYFYAEIKPLARSFTKIPWSRFYGEGLSWEQLEETDEYQKVKREAEKEEARWR